jgi:hypothetical protein
MGTWRRGDDRIAQVSSADGEPTRVTGLTTGTTTVVFEMADGLRAEARVEVVRNESDIEDDVRQSLPVELFPDVSPGTDLFLETANPVTFRATNLGDAYDIRIENVTGGVAEATDDARTFILAPSTDTLSFDVIAEGDGRTERFDGIRYGSRLPPAPTIELLDPSTGRTVDESLQPLDLTVLEVAVRRPLPFAANHPDDAAYRVSSVTATLEEISGTDDVVAFSTGTLDLTSFRSQAESGDYLVVDVDGVQRQNYRGDVFAQNEYVPRRFVVPIR